MSHLLHGFPNIIWCNYSGVCWCSESKLPHSSDGLCKSFTNVFVWCIIIHNHRYKLTGTASMFIARFQYQPLKKAMFSIPEICVNISNIFLGGIKTIKITKFLYKIHWDAWCCIILLEEVVCSRLCILLVISDIGFT